MSQGLPIDIREAIISVCGKAFWYRDPHRAFLLYCGVPSEMYDRFSSGSKYVITRNVLAELDRLGDHGYGIQRRILTELCKLRNVPDENVPDRDAALAAIRKLKELALEQKMYVEETVKKQESKSEEAKRKFEAQTFRAQRVAELRGKFNAMVVSTDDPQSRGYSLEDLLVELFGLNEVRYRPPYKTETEQIDGCFTFKGFDYLVEARWRQAMPKEGDLGILKNKVDKKITSTRGVFFSIIGFRPEVVAEFTRGTTSNILLFDGEDLSLILEGHVSLFDALDYKIQKAAQEGIIYAQLSAKFRL
jgi:hypothetical protein